VAPRREVARRGDGERSPKRQGERGNDDDPHGASQRWVGRASLLRPSAAPSQDDALRRYGLRCVMRYGDSAFNYRRMNSAWRSPSRSVIRALSP
jgi:hypothetical protein